MTIAKRVYVGHCTGSHLMGRPQKRWIDTMKECLKKRGLDIRQEERILYERVYGGGLNGNAWGVAWEMNP